MLLSPLEAVNTSLTCNYLTGVKLGGKGLNVKLVEFIQIRRLFWCFYSLQLQNRLARIPGRAYNGLQ